LKQLKVFIEDGVHPRVVAKALRKAIDLAIERIKELAVPVKHEDSAQHFALLEKCASTALSSKLIHQQKHFFGKMAVDAVMQLDELMPLDMIGIKKVQGGALEDSFLVAGVAFKKTFSYAGFEMQPKKYDNPKIAMLNIELELKAERDNAEIRLEKVEVRFIDLFGFPLSSAMVILICNENLDLQEYQKIIDAEWEILYDKLEKIHKSGAQVVLSKLPIGDVATQYFADR